MLPCHTQSIRTADLARNRNLRQDRGVGSAYPLPHIAVEERVTDELGQGEPGQGTSAVAQTLKRLRIKAGLSIAKMAKAIGMSPTTYQHYEDRYKKPRFEQDFLDKITKVLRKHGVTDEELAELGPYAEYAGSMLGDILDELRRMREQIEALRREHRPDGNTN
jgi:transcriptional regulator with XRE-family HTH domain